MKPQLPEAGFDNEVATESVNVASLSIPQVRGDVWEPTHQDKLRRLLALLLIGLLAGVVVVGFALLALAPLLNVAADDVKTIVQLFFTSILTLVSTVIGFYFGSEHKARDDRPSPSEGS